MDIKRHAKNARVSRSVIHNGVVYLSGLVAEDLDQDYTGQTTQILREIDAILAEAGTDKSRLLQAQIFVSDMTRIGEVNVAWEAWADPDNLPARAAVGATFRSPRHKVEIMVTAAL